MWGGQAPPIDTWDSNLNFRLQATFWIQKYHSFSFRNSHSQNELMVEIADSSKRLANVNGEV